MRNRSVDVCPVELAGSLDNRIRRIFQNPGKILSPYLKAGMSAVDIGCGPGFFTLEMAALVGEEGKVIGVDLQEGMLEKIRSKVAGTALENRIHLHKCEQGRIGLSETVDFVLLFYMVHEVPDKRSLFDEVGRLLNPGGKVLIVEPPFHVSKSAYADCLATARNSGLVLVKKLNMFPDKAAVLAKRGEHV